MKKENFETNKKLVVFMHILGELLTRKEIEELIERAEKAETGPARIEPYTAGVFANTQAQRLINRRRS